MNATVTTMVGKQNLHNRSFREALLERLLEATASIPKQQVLKLMASYMPATALEEFVISQEHNAKEVDHG